MKDSGERDFALDIAAAAMEEEKAQAMHQAEDDETVKKDAGDPDSRTGEYGKAVALDKAETDQHQSE